MAASGGRRAAARSRSSACSPSAGSPARCAWRKASKSRLRAGSCERNRRHWRSLTLSARHKVATGSTVRVRGCDARRDINEPMKFIVASLAAVAVLALVACNSSGLSNRPRATFAQIACLDVNGDNQLNAADASDLSKVPDFNGDRKHDEQDAAFLQGVDIPLSADRDKSGCDKPSGKAPEYEVAHGYFDPASVSCDGGKKAVLVVGVGGGVVNLRDSGDAAGVRSIVDGLLSAYDDKGIETIAVISGPAITGAAQLHGSMEQWMTHAVQVYLDRYPCIRVLLLGHSHGAVTADVVASHLEGQYADRFIEVIDIDRGTA